MENILAILTTAGSKLLLAAIAFFAGKFLINKLLALVEKSRGFKKLDDAVSGYVRSMLRGLLLALLVISVIGILGVPMTSVLTILASCGVAVGLALQGSLSNLAGGIMLMIFRPFKKGDFVEAAGVSGVVQDVTLFYTVILTLDNKRVTVPNGSLMNANVTNYSAEALRRVDLVFGAAKGTDAKLVTDTMLEVMAGHEKVLKDPAPFARQSGGDKDSMEFTLRAWCANADYWDVYFDLTEAVTVALGEKGVKAPATRIIADK